VQFLAHPLPLMVAKGRAKARRAIQPKVSPVVANRPRAKAAL